MNLKHDAHGQLVGYEHGHLVFQRPSGVTHKVNAELLLPSGLNNAVRAFERMVEAGRQAKREGHKVLGCKMFGVVLEVLPPEPPQAEEAPHA